MEHISNQLGNRTDLPSTPPSQPRRRRIDWPRTGLRLVAAVIIIILLVLLAIWIFGGFSGDGSNKKGQNGNNSGHNGSSTQKQPSKPSESSNPKNSSGSTGSTNNSSQKSNGSNAPGGNNLSNTGPGDTIALFAATTIAAAGLHYVVNLRRLQKSR